VAVARHREEYRAARGRRSVSTRRCFLLLQGVCSPFFARLADRLRFEGHRILKVNFTGGDLAYWGWRPSWSFRGAAPRLPEFLASRCAREDVTDQILFGDCRPLHRQAIEWASRQGVRTHVFEEGYFRPYWVTLERGGVNARSSLPRDPQWYRAAGGRLSEPGRDEVFALTFHTRARHDVLYHLAGAANPLLFPGYRTHAPVTAPNEYAGYLRRFAKLARIERRDLARSRELAGGSAEYYFLPLQLNGDAQIREHSRFRDMAELMEVVIESFARHAPSAARLLIKNHPLDTGLIDHSRALKELEERFAVRGRVDYLETGDLGRLLAGARGVVTVNSTVGFLALDAGRPTVALGKALYALPGLTFQGSLAEFWQHGQAPDRLLYECFRRTVMHATQVNGGLYSDSGMALAVTNSIAALAAERSPLEELL
jgi:capsular polysaccharide export protein